MKAFIRHLPVVVVASVFMIFVLFPASSFAQKKSYQQTLAAFPDSVSAVFKNSCVKCHSDQSNSKGKIFMNLSDWDKFTAKKQAKKSKAISKKVTNGAMPPAAFLKRRPDAKPTAAQIQSLSLWAKSLKMKK